MKSNRIQPLPSVQARRQLQECLEFGKVVLTRHFRDELSNERIPFDDAWSILRRGNIYDPPEQDSNTDEWKYRIEGHEPGGKWIVIVFWFKNTDTAFLITIFSVSAKRRK